MKIKKEDRQKIEDTKLDYQKAEMFLHCESCLKDFMDSIDYKASMLSPRDAMSYEVSSYPFTYPNGVTANIIVVWCKDCGKKVWDTRHMTHLY